MLFRFAFLTMLSLSGAALAKDSTTYNFEGTVSSGTLAGRQVSIVVTLDRSFVANGAVSNPKRQADYSGGGCTAHAGSPILALSVDGQDALKCVNDVRISRNYMGYSSIGITSMEPHGGYFQVEFSTQITGVVRRLAIPKTIVPGDFKVRTFTFSTNQANSSSGTID